MEWKRAFTERERGEWDGVRHESVHFDNGWKPVCASGRKGGGERKTVHIDISLILFLACVLYTRVYIFYI